MTGVDDRIRLAGGLGLWALLITLSRIVGIAAVPERVRWPAFPLYGDWMAWTGSAVVIIGGASVLLVVVYAGAQRVGWTALLVLGWLSSGAFMALLASDGTRSFGYPLELDDSYRRTLRQIPSLAYFVRHFIRDIDRYPIHTRGHPPGAVVLLGWLDHLGVHSTSLQLLVLTAIAAMVTPCAAVTCRAWADEETARSALPFVALAPAAVWAGVTLDGTFAGVSAAAIALIALATTRHGRSAGALAIGSGIVWSAALHLSYGLSVLLAVTMITVILRRRIDAAAWALLGVLIGTVPWILSGFVWWRGLASTREQYFGGIGARLRPQGFYATLGNPALAAILIGPVVGAALALRRSRAAAAVIALGVAAMALADLSGLSKAEVERIWVPFAPWVTVGAAALPRRWRVSGLVLHVGWAVALALSLDFVR